MTTIQLGDVIVNLNETEVKNIVEIVNRFIPEIEEDSFHGFILVAEEMFNRGINEGIDTIDVASEVAERIAESEVFNY